MSQPFAPPRPDMPQGAANSVEYEHLLISLGDGLISTDELGCITYMNPVAERLSRWTLADARGRQLGEVFRIVDEDTGWIMPCRADEVLARGESWPLPLHAALLTKGEHQVPIGDSIAPVLGDHGEVIGVVVVFRDQTQERFRQRVLDASRVRLVHILEASIDGIVVCDEEGQIVEANGAASEIFGHDTLVGMVVRDLFPQVAGTVGDDPVRGALGHRVERVGLRLGGAEFPLDVSMVHLYPEPLFALFIRDLTDVVAVQRALADSRREQRKMAEQIELAWEGERLRIARDLHDALGQQLTAIHLDLGWLRSRVEGPPLALERLASMHELVTATFTIIRRLSTDLRLSILDHMAVAQAIEWQAAEFSARSGIAVAIDTGGAVCPLGPSLSTAVYRVFSELLTNVARHAKATRVTGRLKVSEEGVLLEVIDDGVGLRSPEVSNPQALGLLGIRERAERRGGSVEITTQRRGGTRVTWRVPLCDTA